jgi:hypothetical protein
MNLIWSALSDLSQQPVDLDQADPLYMPSGDVQQQIFEWLFQLSCLFLTDTSLTGDIASSPLVYFVGVFGIHQHSLMYRTAYIFTPMLAGFIWIGRLLILEYALPGERWEVLKWPAKTSDKDQTQRFRQIRDKYLCRGGFHPMGYLIETLRYGRAIARKEGSRGNVSWSPDKETLQLYNQQLTMTAFREMVWSTVRDCRAQLQELMFGWEPAIC